MTVRFGAVWTALFATVLASSAPAQDIVAAQPAPSPPDPARGSLYLQCDGNPNNMSAGESVARFIGAVTLLGIFAPRIESPDASKRLFGTEGVAACTQLIDGEHREGSPIRRLPLILARALHRIEAKDYRAAIGDVAVARGEAKAAGLTGDPYFERSLGLSFDMIEAEALFAAGDVSAARAVALRRASRFRYGYYALIGIDGFSAATPLPEADDLVACDELARIVSAASGRCFALLEEQGRFADAASRIADLEQRRTEGFPKADRIAWPDVRQAIDLALAGDWTGAADHAAAARDTEAKRDADGKPEANRAEIVEGLDFYTLLAAAHGGRLAEARRGYAARSEWTAPSFGMQVAALNLLRPGAPPEELSGALATSPDMLWRQRRDRDVASRLERYKNNKFLWARILPYASAPSYERLSRPVWDGVRARFVAKAPLKDTNGYLAAVSGDPLTQMDALLLHAAVVAKARGRRGFYLTALPDTPGTGLVVFADPPTDGARPSALFLDADAVIAELQAVIPTPQEAERRRAARDKPARTT